MERQNKEMLSRMVTNAIVTYSGKSLGKDIELNDDPTERENDEETNVKRTRPNNDE